MALSREELGRRAARVRLVVTDCDGVLTDGAVLMSDRGDELRRFSVRDAMGFERLRDAGISLAIISAEVSPAVGRRAAALGARALLGIRNKSAYLETVLDEMQLTAGEAAYIGDDLDDLDPLRAIAPHGLAGAPSDAAPEVKALAHHVTASAAGHGAFRGFADWILSLRA
jgi:3-deoxy-D-manno-octulosonate 8-phosphate phosphatase (KDO 8-P phosphatase)